MACAKTTSEFMRKNTTYDQQFQQFEDELKQFLSKCNSLNSEFEPFLSQRKEDLNIMKKEGDELQKSLLKARNDVIVLASRLHSSDNSTEVIKDEAALINSIKQQIRSLKLSQATVTCQLGSEEDDLYQEILERYKWFHSWKEWEHTVDCPEKCTLKHYYGIGKFVVSNLPPEVKEFEDFLVAMGGHTGGWEDYEHQLFIRERSRFQNPTAFFKAVAKHIFGKTQRDVEKHESWYREYLEKKERKQFAIFQWKAEKEKEERQRFMQKQQERIEERIEKSKELRKFKAIRASQQEMIAAWKLRKNLDKMEEMKKQEKIVEQKKQAQAKKKEEQEEIRKRVEEYRVQKKKVDSKEDFPTIDVINKKNSMKYFQEKDMLKLKEKEGKMKAMKEEKQKQEMKLENLKKQVAVSVQRDPNRLFQSTVAWKERQKTKTSPKQNSPISINTTPSRAIPNWRKGLYN